jgi:hypothetical protein
MRFHGKTPAPSPEIPKLDTKVTLWLILFVLGGGLLALYYAGIGYFPEVTWQDALSYMALMAIIGGGLLVAYGFLLFMPGAIWSEFLIHDRNIGEVLKMETRAWEACVWLVTKKILLPFALFMAFCHFLLFLLNDRGEPIGFAAAGAAASLIAVSGLLWRDLSQELEHKAGVKARSHIGRYRWIVAAAHLPLLLVFLAKALDLYTYNAHGGPLLAVYKSSPVLWIAGLLPLASFAFADRLHRWHERRKAPDIQIKDRRSLLCRATLAFGVAALLSLAALWFFYHIYRSTPPGASASGASRVPLSLLLLCTLLVIVTNLAVSVIFHKHHRSALLISFLAAVLLLGAGQLLARTEQASLPAKIMEGFGFGARNATLVLTERGGRILCSHCIPVQLPEAGGADFCAQTQPLTEEQRKQILTRVEGLTILSRLGAEYLVRFEAVPKKSKAITIALPKSEVVSWSVADPAAY